VINKSRISDRSTSQAYQIINPNISLNSPFEQIKQQNKDLFEKKKGLTFEEIKSQAAQHFSQIQADKFQQKQKEYQNFLSQSFPEQKANFGTNDWDNDKNHLTESRVTKNYFKLD